MARHKGLFRRGERVWWLPNEGSQRQVTVWDDSGHGLVRIVDGTFLNTNSPMIVGVRPYELSPQPFEGVPLHSDNHAA